MAIESIFTVISMFIGLICGPIYLFIAYRKRKGAIYKPDFVEMKSRRFWVLISLLVIFINLHFFVFAKELGGLFFSSSILAMIILVAYWGITKEACNVLLSWLKEMPPALFLWVGAVVLKFGIDLIPTLGWRAVWVIAPASLIALGGYLELMKGLTGWGWFKGFFATVWLSVIVAAVWYAETMDYWQFLLFVPFGILLLIATLTDTLHLIPGDTATEAYRARMILEEMREEQLARRQARNRTNTD